MAVAELAIGTSGDGQSMGYRSYLSSTGPTQGGGGGNETRTRDIQLERNGLKAEFASDASRPLSALRPPLDDLGVTVL